MKASQRFLFSKVKECNYSHDLSKSWFVYFTIKDTLTGKSYPKQFRGGINLEKSMKGRTAQLTALRLYWQEKIDSGWNPLIDQTLVPLTEQNILPLNEALDFALSEVRGASKTKGDYKGTVTFFKKAAIALSIDRLPAHELRRRHIKLMLKHITETRNWSNKAYNKNLGYISAVFTRLVEWEIVEYNPASKIKTLPVAETEKYQPLTAKEKKIVREYMFMHHYRFFIYLIILYHTGF